MDHTSARTGNLLIDALTLDERNELLEVARRRRISVGESWMQAGDPITSVVFPTEGIISVIAETGESSVEAATIGREGALDAFAALGSRTAPQLSISQVSGEAIEVPAERFEKVYDTGPKLKVLTNGYVEALFVQTSVNAACLASHHLNERCARWLLQTHDRVDTDTFDLKQEFLARMLGVHRPSVSIAAKTLQASGVIAYSRGSITILDREGLEEAACACYETIRTAYSRLVPLA